MGADYYLVNKQTRTKVEVMGRGINMYNPDMVACFLRDNLNENIELVELNTLTDLENPEPYKHVPYEDYEGYYKEHWGEQH